MFIIYEKYISLQHIRSNITLNQLPNSNQYPMTELNSISLSNSTDFSFTPPPKKKRKGNIHLYRNPSKKYSKQHIQSSSKPKKHPYIYIYHPHIPITCFITPFFSPSMPGFCCQRQVAKVNSATKRFVSPANKISLMAWWRTRGVFERLEHMLNYKPTEQHIIQHIMFVCWFVVGVVGEFFDLMM